MVLVTGGTGLVGSHLLLRLCEKGTAVRALYRHKETLEKTKKVFRNFDKESFFSKIDWIYGDIINVPSLEPAFLNITEVYHCAALISFDPNDEEKLRKVNIEGTANIVNLSLANKIRKLCYVSSVAALGDLKSVEKIVTEDCEWNPEKPHTDYAISKYGAEMEIWRGQQEGLQVVIANPGIILGAGFWDHGSGEIFSRIERGLKFYTSGITGYVDVEDVAQILIKLMESELSNHRFIVVSENISYKNVLELISKALNVKKPTQYASPIMLEVAWRCDWFIALLTGRKRSLSKETANALHSKTYFSSEKVEKYLGHNFKPINTAIEELVKMEKASH